MAMAHDGMTVSRDMPRMGCLVFTGSKTRQCWDEGRGRLWAKKGSDVALEAWTRSARRIERYKDLLMRKKGFAIWAMSRVSTAEETHIAIVFKRRENYL